LFDLSNPWPRERHYREGKAALALERVQGSNWSSRPRRKLRKKAVGKVTVKNNNWSAISRALMQESPQIQCDRAK
jgi:hypothetical protein